MQLPAHLSGPTFGFQALWARSLLSGAFVVGRFISKQLSVRLVIGGIVRKLLRPLINFYLPLAHKDSCGVQLCLMIKPGIPSREGYSVQQN